MIFTTDAGSRLCLALGKVRFPGLSTISSMSTMTTKVLGDTSQPHNATNLGLVAETRGWLMISSGFKHEADRPIAEITHSTTRSQDL